MSYLFPQYISNIWTKIRHYLNIENKTFATGNTNAKYNAVPFN